ncbi:MAG: hypothetical protein RSE37_22040, partial [Citrobacter sp.]
MVIMKGLYKRKDKSQFYGVRRVIPARLRHLLGDKTELKTSLGTADYNEALSKAPAVWLGFANAIAKAERQLKAEQSFTDADIELIAGLWTSFPAFFAVKVRTDSITPSAVMLSGL